ncbi:hypothetical protein JHN49_11305 [Streptomyces sp. MBT57]|nr:hypothetical protein [Streptomyces sp. MBT57]
MGAFTLTEDAIDGRTGCYGTDGYDDIEEGTSVTVYDGAGDITATGILGTSTYAGGLCVFDIAIDNVPTGEKFYQVEVSHRGKVHLTADEAEAGKLSVSLG